MRVSTEVTISWYVAICLDFFNQDQQVTEQELIAFCREKLASNKVPKQIEIREQLPKTAVGKVLRRFLIDEEKQKAQTDQVAAGKEEQ